MHIDRQQIEQMPARQRAALINCLSGFKSANLVGTCDSAGQPNLAIVSSVVHLGAAPPLLAFISRPPSVERHTLANLTANGYFTINHVHLGIIDAAHQTSARYPAGASEFDATGLRLRRSALHPAPYVAESHLTIGLALRALQPIALNNTVMVIGEIIEVTLPDDAISVDGFIDLSALQGIAVAGLDGYYQPSLVCRFDYAKPDTPPRRRPLPGEAEE